MATEVGSVWPLLTCFERAAEIARRGVRTIPADPPRPAREWNAPRHRDLEAAAAEEARTAHVWADGMSPAEYLEALVDRAQAKKETPNE